MPNTDGIDTITLAELNSEASLLTRIDRKYLLTWLIVGWLGCLGAGCCWDCGGCVGWGAH